MANQLMGFMFENSDILGAMVELDSAFLSLIDGHNYPSEYKALMSQFIAANILLTNKLKFEGSISLQARGGSDDLTLALSECNEKLEFRGIMRGTLPDPMPSFKSLFDGGVLALTIDPNQGKRYQSMVPLEKNNLAGCIQDYFELSEQIPTWFYLLPSENAVRGLMLQALPSQLGSRETRDEDWSRLTHLASTIKPKEILSLSMQDLLYRLYHEESVRIFDPKEVKFQCGCSQESMERALISLGRDELESILQEQGKIDTQCEFCGVSYKFGESEIHQLLQAGSS